MIGEVYVPPTCRDLNEQYAGFILKILCDVALHNCCGILMYRLCVNQLCGHKL